MPKQQSSAPGKRFLISSTRRPADNASPTEAPWIHTGRICLTALSNLPTIESKPLAQHPCCIAFPTGTAPVKAADRSVTIRSLARCKPSKSPDFLHRSMKHLRVEWVFFFQHLQGVEPAVFALSSQQLFVRSLFGDGSVNQNHDAIRIPYRR